VSKVVLVGGGAQMKDIANITRQYFDAPVILGDPFERVQAPAFITDVLKGAGPSFAAAVGLAIRALEH
jgi:Tfp pilus assembly PilM family ATPase